MSDSAFQNSGYCPCACGPCFDIAISDSDGNPALCNECESAGCEESESGDCARCDDGSCSHDSCADPREDNTCVRCVEREADCETRAGYCVDCDATLTRLDAERTARESVE